MLAMQIDRFGSPEVLVPTELPVPDAGPGQLRIRVTAAAVNFADVLRRRDDRYPFPTSLPFVPGSEVAGTVDALGVGVDGPAVGTRVFAAVGEDGSTGYAQFAVAAAHGVVPIPPGVSDEQAATLVVAGTTAVLTLTEVGALAPGETVLIGGAGGGVGGYAVQVARQLGAGTVVGLASTEAGRAQAKRLGADATIDPTLSDWSDRVLDVAPEGVDVALESAGGSSLASMVGLLAPFGRAVVLGMASGAPGRLTAAQLESLLYDPARNQSLRAFNLGVYFGLRPHVAVEALTQLVGWVAAGDVEVPVGGVLPLTAAAEAHRRLESREAVGKLVLQPWAD